MVFTCSSLKLPIVPSAPRIAKSDAPFHVKMPPKLLLAANPKPRCGVFKMRAVEEESKESTKWETEKEAVTSEEELGREIKKAMMERKREEEKEGLLSGVAEEVGEIEWPAFGKVLGTTGVVLAVIAGSSVVLLTVNAVLAELSDRVFGGRGVQDILGS